MVSSLFNRILRKTPCFSQEVFKVRSARNLWKKLQKIAKKELTNSESGGNILKLSRDSGTQRNDRHGKRLLTAAGDGNGSKESEKVLDK